jgi:hypothetical protein
MTLGLGLLATLGSGSATWIASVYMLVLGLGLGMVMQVLVLAVQNAIDYRELGVATSGTTLFRSTGGSVGVSLFGAIFAASLASGLADRLPGGMAPPNATDPSAIGALPLELRGIYLDVFTTALHPVFLLAAALGAMAFALTWPLKEEPLRGPARSETAEIFVAPRDATSVEELEAILNQLQRRENRWAVIQRMARTLAVPLAPDEIWLLVQLCRERTALQSAGLGDRLGIPRARIDDIADRLTTAGLIARAPDGSLTVAAAGQQEFDRMVVSYGNRLAQLVVNPTWVRDAGDGYARALLSACEGLAGQAPRRHSLKINTMT